MSLTKHLKAACLAAALSGIIAFPGLGRAANYNLGDLTPSPTAFGSFVHSVMGPGAFTDHNFFNSSTGFDFLSAASAMGPVVDMFFPGAPALSSLHAELWNAAGTTLIATSADSSSLGIILNSVILKNSISDGFYDLRISGTAINATGVYSGFVATVPEPEIYAMIVAGLGLMGFVARRRRKLLNATA